MQLKIEGRQCWPPFLSQHLLQPSILWDESTGHKLKNSFLLQVLAGILRLVLSLMHGLKSWHLQRLSSSSKPSLWTAWTPRTCTNVRCTRHVCEAPLMFGLSTWRQKRSQLSGFLLGLLCCYKFNAPLNSKTLFVTKMSRPKQLYAKSQ